MNQRELQRAAKEWFMEYGSAGRTSLEELRYSLDLSDDDMLALQDYFNMTVRRTRNELFR